MSTNITRYATLTKQLQLLPLNINIFHNDDKRMAGCENIINKNIDIVLLQEMHTTPEISFKWEKEWKGKSLWHSGPILKSSGVAILFKEKLQFEIINSETDLDGRILKCIIQLEKQLFQIINIYAPTNSKNKQNFYQELPKYLEKQNNTILAGDFNMIEDISLDKLGGNTSSTHLIGLNKLTELKNAHNLVDIWRKSNPLKKLLTYHNPDKTIHTRLDRIYISTTIKSKTSKIYPIPLSDCGSVSVTFQISEENPRGEGIWKMNTSILKQKQFQEIFKNFWTYWQNKKNIKITVIGGMQENSILKL